MRYNDYWAENDFADSVFQMDRTTEDWIESEDYWTHINDMLLDEHIRPCMDLGTEQCLLMYGSTSRPLQNEDRFDIQFEHDKEYTFKCKAGIDGLYFEDYGTAVLKFNDIDGATSLFASTAVAAVILLSF